MSDLEERIAATRPSAASFEPVRIDAIVDRARRRQVARRGGSVLAVVVLVAGLTPTALNIFRARSAPDVALVSPVGGAGGSGSLGNVAEDTWSLPDRNDEAVRREEARLAPIVARSDVLGSGLWPLSPRPQCKVRLLGTRGDSSFVWARCAREDAAGVTTEVSLPARVDGDIVRVPAEGSEYAASVRQIFPAPIAEAILRDRDTLKP